LPVSDAQPVWARHDAAQDRWLIALHVQPGARSTEIVGEHGGRLKLKISAPPVDNKANAVLLAWLAARLGLPKAAVELVRGQSSRQKTVAIRGLDRPERLLDDTRQA
jgi:hypothetical protein